MFDLHPILDVALRSLCVYLFMVFAIRLFGKNQLSQLNAGDVILLLLISNAVQNAMVGENTSLEGGLVAALVLFAANFILKKFIFKSPAIKKLIQSEPEILLRDGVIDQEKLKELEISMDELREAVREHGVEDPEDVKLAVLEVDGNISVISMEKNKNQNTVFSRHKRKFPRKSRRI